MRARARGREWLSQTPVTSVTGRGAFIFAARESPPVLRFAGWLSAGLGAAFSLELTPYEGGNESSVERRGY